MGERQLGQHVPVWRPVMNMLLTVAIAYLFNFLPEKVGVYRSAADLDTFAPLLAPEFSAHLPGLNVWWGLSFTFHLAMLALKRWTPALRWAQAGLGFVGAMVLARLALVGPFLPSAGVVVIRYLLAAVAVAMLFTAARQLNALVNGRWLVFGPDPTRK